MNNQEAKGFVEIISNYAKSWALLQGYDEQTLQEVVALESRSLSSIMMKPKKRLPN